MKKVAEKKLTRRELFKMGGAGVAGLAVMSVAKKVTAAERSLKGKKYAMVIDRQRCTGCGGCTIACKNENNVQTGHAWAYRQSSTEGKFPNVRYNYFPTLCNHCHNAPCVRICPTGAMHKDDGDITDHSPEKCIGCKSCMSACPYNVVIWRNSKKTHKFWRGKEELIKGCTESPRSVVQDVKGEGVPFYNPDREKSRKGSGLRYKGIVEKCTFCDHRLKRGKLPYCVLRCPASARIFGDLNDPNSKVSELLGKYKPVRLKEHLGTEPKIYCIRDFNPSGYRKGRGSV